MKTSPFYLFLPAIFDIFQRTATTKIKKKYGTKVVLIFDKEFKNAKMFMVFYLSFKTSVVFIFVFLLAFNVIQI